MHCHRNFNFRKGIDMRNALRLLAIITLFGIVATSAHAQLSHTWVASNGTDTANCDRPTPCSSFASAYNKTNAGGEIICIDSSYYGGITINKSITVNCEGAIGSTSTAGTGTVGTIFVNGLAATDVVILRGLDLDGASASSGGG